MKKKTSQFNFAPADFIPFRDKAAVERVRKIKKEDIAKHKNPDFRITVMPGEDMEFLWIFDMFTRIRNAMEAGKQLVMITPNPWPRYVRLAHLINTFKVDCRRLYTFNMDEYANEKGEIAPETWEFGFMHAFKKYFWAELDPKLRPPEKQIQGPTNKNIKVYGKMLADLGGADICYSGPGWTGHLAFIEPCVPEFAATSLEEWKQMGSRICTLHPLTIAQKFVARQFRHERRPLRGAAEGRDDRAGGGHCRQTPHRQPRDFGGWLVCVVAAVHLPHGDARTGHAARAGVDPPNPPDGRLRFRKSGRKHRAALEQRLLRKL